MSYDLEMHEHFTCNRSITDVFDYVVDFSRIQEWDHTIVASEKTSDGAIGLGTRFKVVFAMGPRRIPIKYEITEFDYPNKAVLVGRSGNFTATDTMTLSETGEGCEMHWHAHLEFIGFAAKTVPFIKNKVVAGGRKTIRDLEVALSDEFGVPKLGTFAALADKLVFPGVMSFSKLGYQIHKDEWNPVTASMKGKHVVITGATSGLGRATAEQLAHLGANLTLVARDKSKAERTVDEIHRRTGNNNLNIEIADLSLMQDVLDLSKRLLEKKQPIDVLINNAGALFNDRATAEEGLERSFAILLLSPFILTEQLQILLAKADGARIINVSSGGMYAKRISISNLESTEGSYRGAEAYARAKRGLVILGEHWAEEWARDGITVHNMHPGWAQTPGVESSLPGFTKATRRILRTPEQGADTIIWLANATEAARTSGLFWLDRLPHTTHLVPLTRESDDQREMLIQSLNDYAARFIGE